MNGGNNELKQLRGNGETQRGGRRIRNGRLKRAAIAVFSGVDATVMLAAAAAERTNTNAVCKRPYV